MIICVIGAKISFIYFTGGKSSGSGGALLESKLVNGAGGGLVGATAAAPAGVTVFQPVSVATSTPFQNFQHTYQKVATVNGESVFDELL